MTAPVYAAIEAGGTKFVCAIGDDEGALLDSVRIATRDPETTLGDALQYFAAAATRFGAPCALGIASFGPIELARDAPRYGHFLRTPKPGWSDVDLVTPFARALAVPVALDTDVNAAALAEAARGAGRGLDSLVYVTVGTGIGGGVIAHGRPLHGLLHPELGHLHPRRHPADAGFPGVCPYHGDCLEGLASGPAIVARLGHDLADAAPSHPIWEIEADYLGQLCAQLALTVSPQRIVLGGGVLQQTRLLPMIRVRAQHWLGGYLARRELEDGVDDYIVAPSLSERSGILGALLLAQRARA